MENVQGKQLGCDGVSQEWGDRGHFYRWPGGRSVHWTGKESHYCITCNLLVLDFKSSFSRLFDNSTRIVMRSCSLVLEDVFNVTSSSFLVSVIQRTLFGENQNMIIAKLLILIIIVNGTRYWYIQLWFIPIRLVYSATCSFLDQDRCPMQIWALGKVQPDSPHWGRVGGRSQVCWGEIPLSLLKTSA